MLQSLKLESVDGWREWGRAAQGAEAARANIDDYFYAHARDATPTRNGPIVAEAWSAAYGCIRDATCVRNVLNHNR